MKEGLQKFTVQELREALAMKEAEEAERRITENRSRNSRIFARIDFLLELAPKHWCPSNHASDERQCTDLADLVPESCLRCALLYAKEVGGFDDGIEFIGLNVSCKGRLLSD
jgi:hypothetical protein